MNKKAGSFWHDGLSLVSWMLWAMVKGPKKRYKINMKTKKLHLIQYIKEGLESLIRDVIRKYAWSPSLKYESDSWYNKKGRIGFTCNKGLTGMGFSGPNGTK
jgi:hypothetical protein